MQLLLITGPAGIGKSTLSWAMGTALAEAGVAHAIIESDELDRVHPSPKREELEAIQPGTFDVSTLTLAALWGVYRRLGHTRLILSGVMLHVAFDRRWILAAIPDAEITIIRLQGSDETLLARLARREIGPGADAQAERSLGQARRMAEQDQTGFLVEHTDGKTPDELAIILLKKVGWL